MKQKNLLWLFIIFSFSVFSMKISDIPEAKLLGNYARVKDIEITEVIDLNNINSKISETNAKRAGIETYSDGRIKVLSFYSGKVRNGAYYEYYPNGDINKEVNYINGKKEGMNTEYSVNRTKNTVAEYKNDLLTGVYTEYLNEKVSFRVSYVNGQKGGAAVVSAEKGKKTQKNLYLLDLMTKSIKYYPGTSIIRLDREIDPNGLVHEKSYDKNGVLSYSLEGILVNNKVVPNGTAVVYGRNGEKLYEYNYENGRANGKYLEYNKDNTVKMQTNLRNGNHNGDVFLYYPNGNIEVYCSDVYKRDIRGTCYKYDNAGKIKQEKTYEGSYPGLSTSWGIREVELLDFR